MKKITFIAILLLCICSLTKAKEKVIEQPPFIAWTSTSIQVDKVVLSDTATVLYIKAFYHPKQWIRISGQSFLKDNNGETCLLYTSFHNFLFKYGYRKVLFIAC